MTRPPGHRRLKCAVGAAKKTRYHPTFMRPVPQTDTRGRVEHTKAHGLTTVKELGKLAL